MSKGGILFPHDTFTLIQAALLMVVTLLGNSIPVRCANIDPFPLTNPSPISMYSLISPKPKRQNIIRILKSFDELKVKLGEVMQTLVQGRVLAMSSDDICMLVVSSMK